MAVRLNGWQRIGVVVSALWLFVFLFWGLNDYLNGSGAFVQRIPGETVIVKKGTAGHCAQIDPAPASTAGRSVFDVLDEHTDENGRFCLTPHFIEGAPDVKQQLPDRHEFLFAGLLFVAVVPLLLAWFVIYLCVFCVRWIAKGFKQNS